MQRKLARHTISPAYLSLPIAGVVKPNASRIDSSFRIVYAHHVDTVLYVDEVVNELWRDCPGLSRPKADQGFDSAYEPPCELSVLRPHRQTPHPFQCHTRTTYHHRWVLPGISYVIYAK